MTLSIIIVHYKTLDKTMETLKHVYASAINKSYEVIMVDNASQDGSVEKIRRQYPDVKMILNPTNEGFAAANNKGIAASSGEVILLLNSDVTLPIDGLQKSLDYLEAHAEIGILGVRLILADGRLDHTCKRGFPTPAASLYYFLGLHKKYPQSRKYGRYTLSYIDEMETAEVESVVGAFMMMPRKVLEEVGGLDDHFFMYGEDIDYCYRVYQKGYKVVYYPEVTAIHYKGASSSNRSYKLAYEFHRAMWLFYKKHYRSQYTIGTTVLVGLGIGGMMVLKFLKTAFNRLKK